MKLATWNVNSLTVRLPQVLDWLAAQAATGSPVDVLALQELKMADDKFPVQAFADVGYHAEWLGQKTYNGVALISRTPASGVVKNLPNFPDDQSRVIAGSFSFGGATSVRDRCLFPQRPSPRQRQIRLQNGLAACAA